MQTVICSKNTYREKGFYYEKNNFVIFNYFNFIIVFLCKQSNCKYTKYNIKSAKTTDSVSEPTSVPATEQPKQKNKGTVSGKYDVEIVTAKTATDFQGNPAIIVTYNFTNNSNANASFLTSVSANAFQNSVQCNVATMMPDVMDAQPSLAEVQPGGTITLECAYSLQDTANPITVQVGPLINVTGEINAQMTFNFKNN